MADFLRPRGDITTVLDIPARDAQDGYFFPLDTENSWFHRDAFITHPSTMSVQEFTHKGTAEWGGRMTFDLNSLQAGDLLQALVLQITLGHWYDANTILKLNTGEWTVDASSNPWTYANGLGSSIIEYAEFEVGDQTIERLDGEFIRLYSSLMPDINMLYGVATDGLALGSFQELATNTGPFNPNRPWPTQGGVFFCVLPFFFLRTRFKEVFPLLSCTEGSVRLHVQLRPFEQCVRITTGARQSCTQTPLGQIVTFNGGTKSVTTSSFVPAFQNFRVLTYTALLDGSVRHAYIHRPFEQMMKFVKGYRFDEPYRYLVNKTNTNQDTVEIALPLELNHPTQEIVWVFRRKGAQINNEWGNFTPVLETQYVPNRLYQPWLEYASLQVNGMMLDAADGDWWRWYIAKTHRGGWTAWANGVYGYTFSLDPESHQPSGTGNMSRTSSIRLNLRVRVPPAVPVPEGFDADVAQGWEVYVYAIHLNWMRFENGIAQMIFNS